MYKLEHLSAAWLSDQLSRLEVRYPDVTETGISPAASRLVGHDQIALDQLIEASLFRLTSNDRRVVVLRELLADDRRRLEQGSRSARLGFAIASYPVVDNA